MERKNLPEILYKIIEKNGGRATMMEVFRSFWKHYGQNFTESDDMFYTWNYDIRWAATELRKKGRMKPANTKENIHGANVSPKGIWEIL